MDPLQLPTSNVQRPIATGRAKYLEVGIGGRESTITRAWILRLGCVAPLALLLMSVACGGSDSASPASPTPGSAVPFSTTDLTVGNGAEAVVGRMVTVNYTGWLYDATRPGNKGQQFDSSASRGAFQFVLGAGTVIAGWDQGLPGMRVGGVRQLIIPPALGYGASGNGPIPPNATLLFEIELLDVN